MSRENVEIVRASIEAWNAGDMNVWGELLDSDAIMRNPEDWPEPGPQLGREAVVRTMADARDTWDANALEPISDFVDVGDRVVVRLMWRGAGHGPDLNMEFTCLYTVRKRRIIGLELSWDHADALEAVGLSE
jgi:ketosteroid isomerase-like protein